VLGKVLPTHQLTYADPGLYKSDPLLLSAASKVLITPPLGTPLAGYRARDLGADVIYDHLFVRCLAFEFDGKRFALLSLDVMGVGVDWVEELRRRARRSVGLEDAALFVATTHTHSAQGGLFDFGGRVGHALEAMMGDGTGPVDPVGYEMLLRQSESALRDAFERLEPATISVAEGDVEGIAGNRVRFDRPADPTGLLLAVQDERKQTIGCVAQFNCHPTTLGEADRGISGDFPGVAMRLVERAIGGTALFFNGALGDISTRLTRRAQDYSEVVRFGRLLGGAFVALAGRLEPIEGVSIAASRRVVPLAPRRPEWLGRIEQRVEELATEGDGSHRLARQLLTAREGLESAARASAAIGALESVPVDLHHVSFGADVSFVAVPGEPFSDAQSMVDERLGTPRARLVGSANGYMGYFPSREAYDGGGYEVGVSLVDRGSAEVLAQAAIDLVHHGA
jgi:neutral ceramidase